MEEKMKKHLLIVALFIAASSVFGAPKKLYVAVQNGELRDKNSVKGKVVCNVEYADVVLADKFNKKDKWILVYPVGDSSSKGYIKLTELSEKKLVAGKKVTANAKEIALAGKGFNASVEQVFKTNSDLNYSAVDSVELNGYELEKVVEFVEAGNLIVGD